MRINNQVFIDLKNFKTNEQEMTKPQMLNGTITNHLHEDRVEISQTGRELAADAIHHQEASYFGTAEIHKSLSKLLESKSSEVRQAVSSIIQFNLVPGASDASEQERGALLEMGLSQAKYVADHYMHGDEAKKFLSTMNQIANITKTGTTPVQNPVGAPDDYLNITELMQRVEPDTYAKLSEAIQGDGDWSKLLLDFAKKVPQNREWVVQYREETNKQAASLHAKIANRYDSADTSNLSSFVRDMKSLIAQSPSSYSNTLTRNMDAFAHLLGSARS